MESSNLLAPDAIPLNDSRVLITGGTGSFGHAFVRYITENYSPARLVVFSRDELKQYEMAQVFPDDRFPYMRYFIGDVRDEKRLELALRDIDIVIHAAALKHVPIAEYNPFECLHTNVFGAENIVRAALNARVKKVVGLSTDKAANPFNLYGASKLASERIFIAANALSAGIGTRFSVVRYGNVIGSRGSVIPLFQNMIREGATELPITDSRMTRFWIGIEEGVRFVLSSTSLMQGGETFVPKIPSARICDLAKAMAPNLPQRFIGVRPGEKLHEVMITEEDARNTLELADRYVIEPQFPFWSRASYKDIGAKPVPERFRYASDTNENLLDLKGTVALLQKYGVEAKA